MDRRDIGLPPRVMAAAAARGLGAPLTSARGSMPPVVRAWAGLGMFAAMSATALIGLGFGVPAVPLAVLVVVVSLTGGVGLVVLSARAGTLYLFEGGAVVVRRQAPDVVPWPELVPIERDHRYVHSSGDGNRYFRVLEVAGTFVCCDGEAVRLADVIAAVEVRRAWEALRSGRRLGYGPMTLTPQALLVGRSTIPWAHVVRIRATRWEVLVHGAGKVVAPELARVPRPEVPHQRTLIALGEQLATAARQARAR